MFSYSLIIHGGSWSYDLNDPMEKQHLQEQQEGLKKIIAEGWDLLTSGLSAIDVVEKTINMLEMNPAFNAGIGAAIGMHGQIELDASIMDGRTLACGAVASLVQIPNAISVARTVMDKTRNVFLVGRGANVFAKKHGFTILPKKSFYTPYQRHWLKKVKEQKPISQEVKVSHGTVGVVAMDKLGALAAGTSTGGMTGKLLGRVGDSPFIGAGTYADSAAGAASATGYGEQIIKVGLTKFAIDLIRFKGYSAQKACEEAVYILSKLKDGLGGLILIDNKGKIGMYGNENLPRAYMSTEMKEPVVEYGF